ncbi:folylpolyglutamate synthase/dihydrofolate synthase family protein [Reichenbachiella sp.]|uniref:bifunctional folylpolyglutamate synthase/dihydrofolate synthase n=1 Tax=Reichenbachiella sp. TaxID=2184521 RepID=UPI00329759B3
MAFKKDLTNTLLLAQKLGNPHQSFESIHVAGTNGKGSTSHLIASVLQSAGYKVGLYTSPHLKSFRERIRVNGLEVSESFIKDFVNQNKKAIKEISPSFFEITVVMAFEHFAKQQVDFAVIETGLGGRLDSTNIISPVISIITSISMDHQDMLGDTIEAIASEKAGIIKENVPVVVGNLPDSALKVVQLVAKEKNAALDEPLSAMTRIDQLDSDLSPQVIRLNLHTVERAINQLRSIGLSVNNDHFSAGIKNVVAQTGLKGRWQILRNEPLVICDVGHNEDAVLWLMNQISKQPYERLHIVWGSVADKSIEKVLPLLIKECEYYFCAANVPRAMKAEELQLLAKEIGLEGGAYASVGEAYHMALSQADSGDLIFVGGSTFVVAEIKDL